MRLSLRLCRFIVGCLFSIAVSTIANAQLTTPQMAQMAQMAKMAKMNGTEQLKEAIDNIRMQTNTPGLAVGMVQVGQADWQYYSGLSDLESRKSINKSTQFRFGSISKILVAMSILKLVESGDIDLQDTIRELAPELEFANPWQTSHPLRVVHLLNHTSAWDSPHLKEHIPLSSTPVGILEALQQYPQSRTSRWPPGTRSAYNNTGFLVAAYLVEKVSGMSYESYVTQTFFNPLNMDSTAYYFSDVYRNNAASLYMNGRAQPYQHLNNRAAGGINSNISNMLQLVNLLALESAPHIASTELLTSLRTPMGSQSVQKGMEFTWGLGNQIFHANGVPLYGHEGSVRGSNAMLVYSPQHKFGYVIVSTTNDRAVRLVHTLLSDYLTKDLKTPEVLPERNIDENDLTLSGWYKNAAPISKKFSFVQTILPWRLMISDSQALIKPLFGGAKRQLVPAENHTFKHATTGLVVLVPSNDNRLGKVLYYGPNTLVKSNMLNALLPFAVILFWCIMSVSGLLFALIWLPRQWIKKSIPFAAIRFRLWPLLTLGIAIGTLLFAHHMANAVEVYKMAGTLSVTSFAVFIGTALFFIATLWSVWILYSQRKLVVNGFTKWHTRLFSIAHLAMASLLLSQGLIAVRLWA